MTLTTLPPLRALTAGMDVWQTRDINQYLGMQATSAAYDPYGRLTTILEGSSSRTTTFNYGSPVNGRRPLNMGTKVSTTLSSISWAASFTYGTYGFLTAVQGPAPDSFSPAWRAPTSGDRPLASDSNQLLFAHTSVISYDSSGRITEINENTGAKTTQFSYSGSDRRPVTVTESTLNSSGVAIVQVSTFVYGTYGFLSSITQATTTVPAYLSAIKGGGNLSAQIRQFQATHVTTITSDSGGRPLEYSSDAGARVITVTYTGTSRQPTTSEEVTNSTSVAFIEDVLRTWSYAAYTGAWQGAA